MVLLQVKANDSFNDSDDESEKIPRSAALRTTANQNSQESEFLKPAPVAFIEETDTDGISCSDTGDDFGSSEKYDILNYLL